MPGGSPECRCLPLWCGPSSDDCVNGDLFRSDEEKRERFENREDREDRGAARQARPGVDGCELAWLTTDTPAAAKDLEDRFKVEYRPPLTKQ